MMHLTALRALGDDVPVSLKLIVEGSEEQGTGGLEEFVPAQRRPAAGRRDPGLRHRQRRRRRARPSRHPARTGQCGRRRSRRCPARCTPACSAGPPRTRWPRSSTCSPRCATSGATPPSAGSTATQTWYGVRRIPPTSSARDANVLDGVDLLGDGSVADMVWARPAVTVLGIDCPPVVGSAAAIQPTARARLNLRVPPGMDPRGRAGRAGRPPRGGRAVGREGDGRAGGGRLAVPGADQRPGLRGARRGDAGGVRPADDAPRARAARSRCATSSPRPIPDAEIILMGVEEPQSLMHAPNESVDPDRDREHGAGRGAVPAAVRDHDLPPPSP